MIKLNSLLHVSLCTFILSTSAFYSTLTQASDAYANLQKQSDLKAFAFTKEASTDPYMKYLDEINGEVNSTNVYRQGLSDTKEDVSKASIKKMDVQEVLNRLKSTALITSVK